jgi:putative addiction module antidote
MVWQIAVRRAGGSLTATLPKEVAQRLRLSPGDNLFLVETAQGVLLTPYNPKFERAMKVYERGAKKYRHALRELAK